MPTFPVRRAHRPGVIALGMIWMVMAISGGVVWSAGMSAASWAGTALPIAGVVGLMIAMIVAMIPRPATLEIDRERVVPSWRGPIRLGERRVQLGAWVLGGVDTPIGVVVHVRGDGGHLRIGGEQHDGVGYALDGPSVRSVDCQVPVASFAELLAALGVRPTDDGPLVIPLVKSSQTAGGVVRMMAPWFATMAVLGGVGVGLALSGVGDALSRTSTGRISMTVGSIAVAVVGLVVTVARSMRVRRADLELRATSDALTVVRIGDGRELGSAAWSAVIAEPRRHVVSSRGRRDTIPVLALAIGGYELRVGAWDPTQRWRGEPAVGRVRSPRWLIGAPAWRRLVAKLVACQHIDPERQSLPSE